MLQRGVLAPVCGQTALGRTGRPLVAVVARLKWVSRSSFDLLRRGVLAPVCGQTALGRGGAPLGSSCREIKGVSRSSFDLLRRGVLAPVCGQTALGRGGAPLGSGFSSFFLLLLRGVPPRICIGGCHCEIQNCLRRTSPLLRYLHHSRLEAYLHRSSLRGYRPVVPGLAPPSRIHSTLRLRRHAHPSARHHQAPDRYR